MWLGIVSVVGCHNGGSATTITSRQDDTSVSSVAPTIAQQEQPDAALERVQSEQHRTNQENSAMIITRSGDRLPPPEVSPIEQNGIRYWQAEDGNEVGHDQVGGVLVATDISSGEQLWTLAVYENPIDSKLETDVQWVFFTSMSFDPDGRLRIVNEAGKTFLVDIDAHSVVATP
jgi:hypothetical protein